MVGRAHRRQHIGRGNKAIPLNDSAPVEGDAVWMGLAVLELEAKGKAPSHWTEHLDPELYLAHKEDWPKAYETQGDVLIVKLEEFHLGCGGNDG